MCWDLGGDKFGKLVRLDLDVLLHHYQHGEDYIRVEQWKSVSDVYGEPFWLWDPRIPMFDRLLYIGVVVYSDAKHGFISTQQM